MTNKLTNKTKKLLAIAHKTPKNKYISHELLKKCSECRGQMKEFKDKTLEGIEYDYWKCNKCGEEILDKNQLHNVANKYR